MRLRRSLYALFCIPITVALTPHARADMERPPEILEHRQVGKTIQLMWSPGGDADGTLDEDVDTYSIQRKGYEIGSWTTLDTSADETGVTWTDTIVDSAAWTNHKGDSIRYRVIANTSGGTTHSQEVVFVPSLPLWITEATDGKARLVWTQSPVPTGYPNFVGYRIDKWNGSSWDDLTGFTITDLTWTDPSTTTGTSRYRVQSRHQQAAPQSGTSTRTSNEVEITIHAMCAGQDSDPAVPPLNVIEIVDSEPDSDYDGDDIEAALIDCAGEVYEDLSGAGDDDGVCEPGSPHNETCITGGCILRALPVTYENVAIKIVPNLARCNETTHPEQCLVLDFPAGLVIEGRGSETVFRSPVWEPPYLPAHVLEVLQRDFQVTLRNLVLDGRKHEQVYPEMSNASGWHHSGFAVWTKLPLEEIEGDGLGNDNGICETEMCSERSGGTHDGDGRCEAGEDCADASGDPDSCDTDHWPDAQGCVNTLTNDDGCIHNVEVRNFIGRGLYFVDANRWIVEDSTLHDNGCVNRGYGFDCPNFADAPDEAGSLVGWKTPGNGMTADLFTSDFVVRRNEVYRTAKYGLSFKNGPAESCNGLLSGHQVVGNYLHDLGTHGIFSNGTDSLIHDNAIQGTTTFGEPTSFNGAFNNFGMQLGGFCDDGNVISDNHIVDVAGLAIMWDGDTQTKVCTGSCMLDTEEGNTISGNTIEGACVEKDVSPGTTAYKTGAIHLFSGAGGKLSFTNNTLTNPDPEEPGCRFAFQAVGPKKGIQPLEATISGGSYEIGTGAATAAEAENGFHCGALQVHGQATRGLRKLIVRGDTSITSTDTTSIPKACIGENSKLVVDDDSDDPFAPSPESFASPVNLGGTIVECSAEPEPCDATCQALYADCD
jgi:hypothetical protein